MKSIAIIPARGGSKRLPRKNIRPFAGRPMIAYAIGTAMTSGLFDRVIVSTDDEEIAAVARKHGAEAPFMRPRELADDHTPTVPVIAHAIRACDAMGWQTELACCIYPCVPLLQADDLRQAQALWLAAKADYCFAVAEFPSSVQRALQRDADGKMSPLYPEHQLTRTQDLTPAFYDVGQFYWGRREAWLDQPAIHANGVGMPIPGWRAIDIDTADDWMRAETLYQSMRPARPLTFAESR